MCSEGMTKDQRRKARKYARIQRECIQAARNKPVMAGTGTGKPSDGFKLQIKPGQKAHQSKQTAIGQWQGRIK